MSLMKGGCQNYGPFLDPHYNTAPNLQSLGYPKGNIILTITLMSPFPEGQSLEVSYKGLDPMQGRLQDKRTLTFIFSM